MPPEFVRADFVRPGFAERLTNLFRVVVTPPRVDITRMSFWRTKTARSSETAAMADRVRGLVETQLRQLGFAIQPLPARISETAPKPGSTNELADARGWLARWMENFPWGTAKFVVGDEDNPGAPAKILADASGADAIVCVRFWSNETTLARRLRGYHATAAGLVGAAAGTGGVLAGVYFSHGDNIPGDAVAGLAILAGGAGFVVFREVAWWITGGGSYEDSVPKRATLQIAIVDGATGKVLWANTEIANGVARDIDPLAARLFFNFPK